MLRKKPHERSFTLVETMAAMVILILFVSEVMGVQGNSAFFTHHGRHIIRASYLGKRIMDQVEYYWQLRDFKEMDFEGKDIPIQDIVGSEGEPIYSYKLTIQDWKLPIFQMMAGSLGSGGGDSSGQQNRGENDMISGMLEKVLGKELFKVAHVEISWGEGARRDSETFTYLLTNERKISEVLATLKPTYDKFNQATSQRGAGGQPSQRQPAGGSVRGQGQGGGIDGPGRGGGMPPDEEY